MNEYTPWQMPTNNSQMNQYAWNPVPQVQNVQGFNATQPSQRQRLPQHTVMTVNGREGAVSAPMAPNSSDIFVDGTAPFVWYVRTDSAGFKCEVTPYPVSYPADTESSGIQPPENNSVEKLIEQISSRVTRLEEMASAKPDNTNSKSKKSE